MFPKFWSTRLEISTAYKTLNDHFVGGGATHSEDVESTRLLWMKIKAMFCVIFFTNVVTEYGLPFIIAMIPLINLLRHLPSTR